MPPLRVARSRGGPALRCIPDQGQRPDARQERTPRKRSPDGGPAADRRRQGRAPGWSPRRFARDEAGAVTVEALFWIPFFFSVLMLITDVSMAFFAKAEAFRIVQNANRLYSIQAEYADGQYMDTAAEVETWIETAYSERSLGADAITDVTTSTAVVSTRMTIPIPDVMLFNIFGTASDWVMTVNSQHYIEWPNS